MGTRSARRHRNSQLRARHLGPYLAWISRATKGVLFPLKRQDDGKDVIEVDDLGDSQSSGILLPLTSVDPPESMSHESSTPFPLQSGRATLTGCALVFWVDQGQGSEDRSKHGSLIHP